MAALTGPYYISIATLGGYPFWGGLSVSWDRSISETLLCPEADTSVTSLPSVLSIAWILNWPCIGQQIHAIPRSHGSIKMPLIRNRETLSWRVKQLVKVVQWNSGRTRKKISDVVSTPVTPFSHRQRLGLHSTVLPAQLCKLGMVPSCNVAMPLKPPVWAQLCCQKRAPAGLALIVWECGVATTAAKNPFHHLFKLFQCIYGSSRQSCEGDASCRQITR